MGYSGIPFFISLSENTPKFTNYSIRLLCSARTTARRAHNLFTKTVALILKRVEAPLNCKIEITFCTCLRRGVHHTPQNDRTADRKNRHSDCSFNHCACFQERSDRFSSTRQKEILLKQFAPQDVCGFLRKPCKPVWGSRTVSGRLRHAREKQPPQQPG